MGFRSFDEWNFLCWRRINPKLRDFLLWIHFPLSRIANMLHYGRHDMFNYVAMGISRKCTRRCSYCPVSRFPEFGSNQEMTLKTYRKIMFDLSRMNFNGVITFGFYDEPLVHAKFINFLKITSRILPKVKVLIFTNGDLLDTFYFSEIRKLDFTLQVTQHAPVNETKFEQLLSMRNSYSKMFLKREIEDEFLSTRSGLVDVPNPNILKKKKCTLPSVKLSIDPEGQVVLCCNDFFSEYRLGNINDYSIEEIWEKEYFKKLRKDLLNGKMNIPLCKRCYN